MLLVRETMNCKPGKVRPLVEKFLAMSKLNEEIGLGKFRVMTDFSGGPYWTIVSEIEVESLQDFQDMMAGKGMNEENMKKFEKIMEGYHDLVEKGGREIYKLEN